MSKEVIEIPDYMILKFKDEVSAFNGLKKATIKNKGTLSNQISAHLFNFLETKHIKTHFVELLDDASQKVLRADMIPMEIIIRNFAAGPWMESLGFKDGQSLDTPILEYRYKSNILKDPMINSTHILAMGLCDETLLKEIHDLSYEINTALTERFALCDVDLIDLKLEFGLNQERTLILADSISPDTMRLWDKNTRTSLDKDVFRKDLGRLDEAYETVLNRLEATA